MRLGHTIRLGAWLLIGLNLLMALGAMGILTRMAPAIATIIDRNEKSLQAGEDMLAALALSTDGQADDTRTTAFGEAFIRAENNVTETDEPAALQQIAQNQHRAFLGDREARRMTVAAIGKLGRINRIAMVAADNRARQLGQAGVWGVAFMAIAIFTLGLILVRHLNRQVIRPLEEIHAVIVARRNKESMRRCTGVDLSQDVRSIFDGINEMLDHSQTTPTCHRPAQHDKEETDISGKEKKMY